MAPVICHLKYPGGYEIMFIEPVIRERGDISLGKYALAVISGLNETEPDADGWTRIAIDPGYVRFVALTLTPEFLSGLTPEGLAVALRNILLPKLDGDG